MKKMLIAVVITCLLSSCATIVPEYALPPQELNAPVSEGTTRVIFFNTTNPALFGDGSWRVGIAVDGKGVENLHLKKYVQLNLAPGPHKLKLSHKDVWTFTNRYILDVGRETMYVKVYNGIVSTKYKVLDEAPENFEKKFSPVNG